MLVRAILSVLAAWALLIVLAVGLLLILQRLASIRRSLEKIAMGVRAIERETMPLDSHLDHVGASLGDVVVAVKAASRNLADVDRDLDAVAPLLRPTRTGGSHA